MVLPAAELIAPLNAAGRVNGMEINESEFAGRLRLVKPTGSVAAVVVPDGVSRVTGSVVQTVGRTVAVVVFGLATTCAEELGAPVRETEAAPNSTAEEKKEGSFMGRLARRVFMAEVSPEDKRFWSLIYARTAVFCEPFIKQGLGPMDCGKCRVVYLSKRPLPCRDFLIPLRCWLPPLAAFFCLMSSLSTQEFPANTARLGHSQQPREFYDLAYVRGGDANQRLDLVLPAPVTKAAPLIVWIHGGGWEQGSHHQNPARAMAERGYAVASIGYRLSSQAKYPAQIEDCKAAIRWLRAHAAEYGIDPGRIGIWGASAGGHLAALLGTTAKDRRFDVGENLEQSSAVRCVIDSFGPSDFLHWGDPPLSAAYDTSNNALARLLGGRLADHVELARLASPVTFVDKDAAPFLIMHGADDPVVPAQQSVVLDAALRKAGVESTLIIVPGGGHGGGMFNDAKLLYQMAAFMEAHLRGPARTTR